MKENIPKQRNKKTQIKANNMEWLEVGWNEITFVIPKSYNHELIKEFESKKLDYFTDGANQGYKKAQEEVIKKLRDLKDKFHTGSYSWAFITKEINNIIRNIQSPQIKSSKAVK